MNILNYIFLGGDLIKIQVTKRLVVNGYYMGSLYLCHRKWYIRTFCRTIPFIYVHHHRYTWRDYFSTFNAVVLADFLIMSSKTTA